MKLNDAIVALRSLVPESAVRYVLVGVVNTCVGLGIIYATMYLLGFGDVPANAVGYTVGVLVSFALNRNWTFAHTGAIAPALARFIVVLVIAYLANLATVLTLVGAMGVNRYVAQAAGVVPYTIVGYVGSRFFAFHGQLAHAKNK